MPEQTTPPPPTDKSSDKSARFSFAPREMTDDNIAMSIASGKGRRRTQVLLLAVSISFIFLLGLFLINLEEDSIEVQVSVEKASIDQAGTINLQGVSYQGVTKDGTDFVLQADTASESTDAPDRVLLIAPRARINTPSGAPITIRAHEGDLSRTANTLILTGRVVIVRPDLGYTLQSDEITTNLDTGLMVSDKPVQGFSPEVRIDAEGMVIAEDARDILFTGKSRMTLNRINPLNHITATAAEE